MQQWEIGGHPHRDSRAGNVADVRSNEKVDTRTFKAPSQPLHHVLPNCPTTGHCNSVCVFQGNARHDFIQPTIKLRFVIAMWRLINHIHHGVSGNGITVKKIDDLRLRRLNADHDRAVQEVSVAALMTKPRAKRPSFCQQQDQAKSSRNEHEATGKIKFEGEDHDGDSTKQRCCCADDALELLRPNTKHASVVRAAQSQHQNPAGDHDNDQPHIEGVRHFNVEGDRPAQDEAGDASDRDGEQIQDHGANGVNPKRISTKVRSIAARVGL